jgi:hypothetical protein
MNENDINDKRPIKAFRGITFSNYKKNDAKKELLNNLVNSKIEPSCYWSAEFICSGHFIDLWDIIFEFMAKYIHLGNPKLPYYLKLRIDDFKNIVNNGYQTDILKIRNSEKIRKLFAEIICVLCSSNKKNAIENIKIQKEDLSMMKITHKLKADSINYAKIVFKEEDPKELFVAINEFAWNISKKKKNSRTACYWVEWIFNFESLVKKENKKYCASRRVVEVESKFQTDIVWILWDCLCYEANLRNSSMLKLVKNLQELFCLKYKPGIKKKRKYLLYFAIHLLTETINNSIPIIENSESINNIVKKVNIIYKQIKKNEIKPKTDYLFNNSMTNNNLEKTVKKLDKMNSLMIKGIIPRN